MLNLQVTQEELQAFRKVVREIDDVGAAEFARLDDDEEEAFNSLSDKVVEALEGR